jgi:hypothetical protein
MAACGHIGSWMAQVAARPAVADALAAEGLKIGDGEAMAGQPLFIRQRGIHVLQFFLEQRAGNGRCCAGAMRLNWIWPPAVISAAGWRRWRRVRQWLTHWEYELQVVAAQDRIAVPEHCFSATRL